MNDESVELELAHRRLEVLEVGGVNRIDAAEPSAAHLEAGQLLGRGLVRAVSVSPI